MFRGAITALVTPFRNGQLDEEAYRKHVDWQIAEGIDGLVPCGTTGESATMSHDEHHKVIDIAVEQAAGRVPVIAGTGSNNTAEAVNLTLYAKEAGADAALVITPYYNKPTQAGLVAHFKRIADECSFPMVVYNVPGRTGVNLLPATVAELCKIPEVVGIKEATANLTQVSEVVENARAGFAVISGDDFTVLPLLSVGGTGVISVVSNIAPRDMADLVAAFERGDVERARTLHYKLLPLARAMFMETNPIPVKTSLTLMGRISGEVRMPLSDMEEANLAKLKVALTDYGLL